MITVQDQKFHWRFTQKMWNSKLSIYGETSYLHPLVITFPEFQDSWAIIPSDRTKEVTSIGPKFVSQVIEWALANGWVPTTVGAPMQVEYENCELSIRHSVRSET